MIIFVILDIKINPIQVKQINKIKINLCINLFTNFMIYQNFKQINLLSLKIHNKKIRIYKFKINKNKHLDKIILQKLI